MEKEQIEQLGRSLTDSNFGDVMVVGGGISGIQASLDLAESGFDWIEYVRLTGSGEVDALADVAAIPEPATMILLGIGGLVFVRRK